MWLAIFLAALIIVAYFVYSRKTTSVRMTKEQIELMQDLISDEQERIKIRKQEIIDQGVKEGKTIPLAPILANLEKSKMVHQGDNSYVTVIDHMKNDLIQKYGTHIPVDEAYKLMQKCENDNR